VFDDMVCELRTLMRECTSLAQAATLPQKIAVMSLPKTIHSKASEHAIAKTSAPLVVLSVFAELVTCRSQRTIQWTQAVAHC